MSNIITFPGRNPAPLGYSLRNSSLDYGQTAPRTRIRRNPRDHLTNLSIAVVEANKLDHKDRDWLCVLREGAQSARVLADELSRIVAQAEG
ncbi:hypothetical protein ACWAUC_19715 [Bradyrhizobium guangdongense]